MAGGGGIGSGVPLSSRVTHRNAPLSRRVCDDPCVAGYERHVVHLCMRDQHAIGWILVRIARELRALDEDITCERQSLNSRRGRSLAQPENGVHWQSELPLGDLERHLPERDVAYEETVFTRCPLEADASATRSLRTVTRRETLTDPLAATRRRRVDRCRTSPRLRSLAKRCPRGRASSLGESRSATRGCHPPGRPSLQVVRASSQ